MFKETLDRRGVERLGYRILGGWTLDTKPKNVEGLIRLSKWTREKRKNHREKETERKEVQQQQEDLTSEEGVNQNGSNKDVSVLRKRICSKRGPWKGIGAPEGSVHEGLEGRGEIVSKMV